MLYEESLELGHGTDITPWYMGFQGSIEKNSDNKYVSKGCFSKLSATKVEITELPVGFWTEDFKVLLEEMLDKDLKQYESHCSDKKIKFLLTFQNADSLNSYLQVENNGYTKLENDFKLVSSKNLGITNMYLYNSQGQITKYDTPLDIIRDFYNVRMDYYVKRKEFICRKLEEDMKFMLAKIKFIKSVVSEDLKVSKMKKQEVEEALLRESYPYMNDSYDYLMRIPIYNFTTDKVEELEKEYAKTESILNAIISKSEKSMWLEELDVFEKEYIQFMIEYNEKFECCGSANSKKSKRK
jgi:DNA topoisomerase-2